MLPTRTGDFAIKFRIPKVRESLRALRKNPLAAPLVVKLKDWHTQYIYKKWCRKYKSPCVLSGADVQRWSGQFKDTWKDSGEGEFPRPHVIYVGTSWDQDRSGIAQAINAVADARIFKGPDNAFALRMPRTPREWSSCRSANAAALQAEYEIASCERKIDVIIGQMWNFAMPVECLLQLRKKGTRIVNIGMDDRHSFHLWNMANGQDAGVAGLLPAVDLAATAAPECVGWYKANGVPAIFCPEASDPSLFSPSGVKNIDVSFVGAKYGLREQVVTALRRAGLEVVAHGSGWECGRIETEQVPSLFSRSKIVLGVGGILDSANFTALKMRDFDAPMSGSMYLTQYNPDLHLVYEVGAEIETWASIEQVVRKTQHYLRADIDREKIASAGRARALRDHTWEKRFRFILQKLEEV
jgi:spore maturation protein CgeB